MTLTCTSKEEVDDVLWTIDGVPIPGQKDKIIQYTKLDADFKATCSVRKNGFSRDSSEVDVNIADLPAKPSIVGQTEVRKWETLELVCDSDSAVPGMKYAWTRNGEAISKANKKYYIKEEAEKSNEGKYKCSTTYRNLAAQESDEFDVKISAGVAQAAASLLLILVAAVISRLDLV
ncbi:pregnancy-specific beta-1-glycoprotein 8 [Plakobranchus ocellatus]|uniref:Pregnancy-specific beta-1-glycoprotein 8 n=1 Tax=Plakobranchus ocellatus TaxID=259542 RepID=A0AAV4D683_9GAST|nr:pregnancy-specific beta-1-glycoprotein 8 [Plakobranchus ocellatus]